MYYFVTSKYFFLQERAQTVSPIKQRRQPVARPIPVKAVCDYKQQNVCSIFTYRSNYFYLIFAWYFEDAL